MVRLKLWSLRALRWGLLGLTALIVVAFFGRLIFQLEGRVRVESKGRQKAEAALAVDEAKLSVRDNLHVTVTQPAPQVTVTVAPGQMPSVSAGPGSSRVVTVPSPFAVPGPTVTPAAPSKSSPTVTVTECPVLHLLFLCL